VRHQGNHEGTFPPPIRDQTATPQLAPSLNKVIATPVSAGGREQKISTEATDALKKRRAPLIAAAVVSLGVLGGAFAVTQLGGKKETPKEQVAMPEVMADQGSAVVDQGSAIAEVKPDEGSAAVEVKPDEGSAAVVVQPEEGSAKQVAKTQPKTNKQNVTVKKNGQKTKTETTVTETVAPPPVEETKPLDANTIAARYQTVGAQLKALELAKGADAAQDLWTRYRIIRLTDAMSSQTKRDEAAAILSKLSTEIASRKK
jgi:hypothetical protein